MNGGDGDRDAVGEEVESEGEEEVADEEEVGETEEVDGYVEGR